MEERIISSEKQIQASSEIDEEFSGDRLANDFKRLEKSSATASVDHQLLALKQKLGMLPAGSPPPASKQLNAGAARPDASRTEQELAAEIEELTDGKKDTA
jgi:phage shock protein A